MQSSCADAAKYKNEAGLIFFDGGAGVQPEKLQGVPEPADFDAFWAKQKAMDDRIILDINAHGMRLSAFGADEAYYKALGWEIRSGGMGYAFDPKQNGDPELAYFNGMALRVMRALQYLKSLPEWNGRNLIAEGTSQGGLQTIWAAALDPQVTRAEATVPWCCDIGGTEFGRNRGDEYIGWVPALGYYDPINMARRISKTCQTVIPRAGLGDYVCPPSGVAILYNNIPGPKKITWVQGSTHGWAPPQPNQAYTYSANGAE